MILDILLIPLVLLALIVLIAMLKILLPAKKPHLQYNYDPIGPLLSHAELSFFKALALVVGDRTLLLLFNDCDA